MMTTIQIENKLKRKLDLLKLHNRETYNELIARVVEGANPSKFDKESLIETIEVLSDPILMKNLAVALKEKGGTSLENLEKELGF